MKVEQACRFRTDKYRVFAKSEGFSFDHEEKLAEAFNDTMNAIIPTLGLSLLSCAIEQDCVFLARNTMRSDVHGRKTIFTHAYALHRADYAKLMHHNPEKWLGIPMSSFVDYQAGTQMDTLDLDDMAHEPMDLELLFAKYNLTPARYKNLLIGTYEAITSGKTLCLKTELSPENTEQMVREIAYCALHGLLESLKGRLSFSSGADYRMTLSTYPRDNDSCQGAEFVFGVEDDSFTRIYASSEAIDTMCGALAEMDFSAREEMLGKIQNWLTANTTRQDWISLQLVSTAYFLCNDLPMSSGVQCMAFVAIANAAGNNMPADTADAMLHGMLGDILRQNDFVPNAIAGLAATRYLDTRNEDFRILVEAAVSRFPVDVSVELVDALLDNTMAAPALRLFKLLMQRIGPACEALGEDVRDDILALILSENMDSMVDCVADLAGGLGTKRMADRACKILDHAQGRNFTGMEQSVLRCLISGLAGAASGEAALPDAYCRMLDSHIGEYSADMMDAAAEYYIGVRMNSGSSLEEKLRLLDNMELQHPEMMKSLETKMSSGHENTAELWEHYQTRRLFHDDMTISEVFEVCSVHNTFNNPCGVFETRAISIVAKVINSEFIRLNQSKTSYAALLQYTASLLSGFRQPYISAQMNKRINLLALDTFWNTVTYQQLCCGEFNVPAYVDIKIRSAVHKLHFLKICEQVMVSPNNAQPYIDLIQSQEPGSPDLAALQASAGLFARRILVQRRFISWDLLLLCAWEQGNKIDPKRFLGAVERLNKNLDAMPANVRSRVRSTETDSILLREPAVRKALIRLDDEYHLSGPLAELIDELRGRKRAVKTGMTSINESSRPSPDGRQERKAPRSQEPGKAFGMQQLPGRTGTNPSSEKKAEKGGFFGWKGKNG